MKDKRHEFQWIPTETVAVALAGEGVGQDHRDRLARVGIEDPELARRRGLVVADLDEMGLDLRRLVSVVDIEDNITELSNPALSPATLSERPKVLLRRRVPDYLEHRRCKAEFTRPGRSLLDVRRGPLYKPTSEPVASHNEVVTEDLNITGMKRSMRRRVSLHSVSDVYLGLSRPTVRCETSETRTLGVAMGRWFASSRILRGRRCRRLTPTLPAEPLVENNASELLDRDADLAEILSDVPETEVGTVLVGASGTMDTQPAIAVQIQARIAR